MKPSPSRIAYVNHLKTLLRFPMTDAEKARFRSQVAAKDAGRIAKESPQQTIPCEPAGEV